MVRVRNGVWVWVRVSRVFSQQLLDFLADMRIRRLWTICGKTFRGLAGLLAEKLKSPLYLLPLHDQISFSQLNSTQIQRKEAQGAYINPPSLKKQSILFLNNSNNSPGAVAPVSIIWRGECDHRENQTLIHEKLHPCIPKSLQMVLECVYRWILYSCFRQTVPSIITYCLFYVNILWSG